ncbi:molybdate ABC transporter substrate-binding protein [Ornithinimicrobium pratense]|uniref:Molybdate ABC transporter substrate-binding protein n=1 Tax=Ornithinimicrobium pratense TaxID=2593973 RepID=A0A5J6V7Y3_9MICO|nr:molybdate ABC transporter substrate-binding protein [Ornithinimicrobium pratense]QFG69454.1 molybdate ABC transporter substrate-binding protein [Ornithinimicrobium pratense]
MSRRSAPCAAVALTLTLAACSSGTDPAKGGGTVEQTLTVLAAASLTEVFGLMAEDFEADHPGVSVEQSFAASSTIVQQVNEGAPADVIALAGMSSLEPLAEEHRVGEVHEFTTNSLQLAVPPDNPAGITGVEDLTQDGIRLVVCAEQVPCGTASASLFQAQGISPAIASLEYDVRATLTKVELGEADVGIVYRSDVTEAGDRVRGVEIPDDVNVVNSYPILAVSDSPLAQAFVEEVLSERGQQHLTDAGFVAP